MSITTESPRQTGQRVVRPVSRPSRRRANAARRRYVHSAHRPVTVVAYPEPCTEDRGSEQHISWVGAVAGVVGTAVVLLALVGMANLRAASLEPAPAPTVATVQQGEAVSESDVAPARR